MKNKKVCDVYMSFSEQVKEELRREKVTLHNKDLEFVKNIFLDRGFLFDPSKSYCLEFRLTSQADVDSIIERINRIIQDKISFHQFKRANYFILYIKAVDDIIDFLACIGAPCAAMELMQIKMLKDVRNYANRATNFDTANLDKTIMASKKQIAAIKKIGVNLLPEGLQEIARLRIKYPEISLKALGEMLSNPLSRSGVNHRLLKIIQIAKMEDK